MKHIRQHVGRLVWLGKKKNESTEQSREPWNHREVAWAGLLMVVTERERDREGDMGEHSW